MIALEEMSPNKRRYGTHDLFYNYYNVLVRSVMCGYAEAIIQKSVSIMGCLVKRRLVCCSACIKIRIEWPSSHAENNIKQLQEAYSRRQ